MKKLKYGVAALLFVSSLLLAGCGQKEEVDPSNSAKPNTPPIGAGSATAQSQSLATAK